MSETDPTTGHLWDDALDMAALRALAHPLRVELMNELSDFGPATASTLAERLGESSGSTSYHLRQLARHGIIVEDTERNSGRERWWKMAPGGVTIGSPETLASPAGREANELVSHAWHQNNERRLSSFLRRGIETFGMEWMEASTLSTAHLELTREQLVEFGREYYALQTRLKEKWAADGEAEPGDRKRVQVQFNAFPLVEQEDR
ncbi:helix-turn-helix domain-containing protein [Leifsonia sp. F6_8S_P_1B]|uniref:Helix-turn-helix domain-containing protein n=1 Tax=Leifsonia williamsii TaxID=3035919 RepID=A0ABT8KDT8_9MICO|nr:helix-turn-helix domain-containing protein [Leifsonia williamsii]MDN4615133.1 helix-turn-helix domain-containing protein [Leifsonia williamsii]